MKKEIEIFSKFVFSDIEKIVKEFKIKNPEGGILFLITEKEKSKIKKLQQIFNKYKLSLIGAVFPQLIENDNFLENGALLIKFNKMPYYCIQNDLSEEEIEYDFQMRELSENIKKNIHSSKNYTLFLIFDAFVSKIASMLSELYVLLADIVNYAGANAGSETFKQIDCIFSINKIYKNALLAVLLEDNSECVLEHGYKAPEKKVVATATQKNEIISINWQSAFTAYSNILFENFNIKINSSNFYKYAVHFPFGIIKADGQIIVRIPVSLKKEKSIFCVGEIKENSLLTVLEAPKENSYKTIKSMSKQLKSKNEIMLFYCAGRKMHFNDSSKKELSEFRNLLKKNKIYGVLSLGEIGQIKNTRLPELHNGAILCINI
ncbi:MAG: FIST C-terminal domain-containing protein [Spirochaetia bacterium]|nr:FIST C-terminal domain-containing protein [Spirochaetia bacterium]